ncbi:hypothetical protein ACFL21_03100 [Patescibacteria group bacterium]
MSNDLKKINNLNLAESFLQVDFIKGFKYIDKAGEIINAFHQGNKAPFVSGIGIEGLIINDPDSNTKTVKVSPSMFWAHFLSPGSLDLANSQFEEKLGIIFDILDIEKIKRIGWRNYFIKEISNEVERDKITKKFSPSDDIVFQGGLFSCELKDIEINIRINKVQKDDATPALLFDIDCYQKNEDGIKVEEVNAKLSAIKNVLRSDDLLTILNQLIK